MLSTDKSCPRGGNFNMGNSKSQNDIITYVKRDVPGPGKYSVPDLMEDAFLGKGPGGAMTAASRTDYTEVRKQQGKPGPGAYQDQRAFKKTQCVFPCDFFRLISQQRDFVDRTFDGF